MSLYLSPTGKYVLLFFLTALGMWWVFGPLLFAPNAYLLGGAGDALKTYYSVEYFARYSSGHLHTGMNYPYGNHPLFLDMNPLFAYAIRGINTHLFDISKYVVGILNASIILSFFPCSYFTYKILRRNLLPDSFAILFTLIIVFLSPQIVRFTGHLALSYLFFVPMIWYLLPYVFTGKSRIKWLLVYGGSLFLFALIHPYYFFIGAAFFFSYLFVLTLQNRFSIRSSPGYTLAASLWVISPAVMIKAWEIALTGELTDYVQYPYGFFAYIAGFESIFLPLLDPLHEMWTQVIRLRRMELEGYAYVGVVGLIIFAFTLYRIANYLLQKQWNRILRPVLPDDLRTALWAGTLLLIPAMAYPFQWFPGLEDYLGPLRQFRSLGRLAWPFYYVFMAYAALLIYQLHRRFALKHRPMLAWGIVMASCISWGISSWVLVRSQQQFYFKQTVASHPERTTDFQQALTQAGYQSDDFQAILGLPFYHIGTEKIALPHWHSNRASFALSLDTGLPLINNKAARMPLQQGLEAIQLVSSPEITRVLPDKFPQSTPLLLCHSGQGLSAAEQALIDRSIFITQVEGISLYSLSVSDLKTDPSTRVAIFESLRNSLFHHKEGYYLTHQSRAVLFESYGNGLGKRGDSSLYLTNGTAILYDGLPELMRPKARLEASVWIRADVNSSYLPPLDVQVYKGDSLHSQFRSQIKESRDYDQGWVRASITFPISNRTQRIVISITGERLEMDHLLIRPQWIHVYLPSSNGSSLIYDNYFISH